VLHIILEGIYNKFIFWLAEKFKFIISAFLSDLYAGAQDSRLIKLATRLTHCVLGVKQLYQQELRCWTQLPSFT